MKGEAERKEIVRGALALLHESSETDQREQQAKEAEPEYITMETAAVSILAEHKPDEAGLIVDAWRRYCGIRLDRQEVLIHLKDIRQWQGRKTGGAA